MFTVHHLTAQGIWSTKEYPGFGDLAIFKQLPDVTGGNNFLPMPDRWDDLNFVIQARADLF